MVWGTWCHAGWVALCAATKCCTWFSTLPTRTQQRKCAHTARDTVCSASTGVRAASFVWRLLGAAFWRQNKRRALCTGSSALDVFSSESARYEVPESVGNRVARQENASPLPTRPENEAWQGSPRVLKHARLASQCKDKHTCTHRDRFTTNPLRPY